MPVQVVRRDIGDNGDIRAFVQLHKLEARKLDNGAIIRRNVIQLGKKVRAYIAAEKHPFARGAQKQRNKRGGCGFAVAPRDGVYFAGAEPEEFLHFARNKRAVCGGRGYPGNIGAHGGGKKQQLFRDIVQITFPADKANALFRQGIIKRCGRKILFIAHDAFRAGACKKLHNGQIAHAHADKAYPPSAVSRSIFQKQVYHIPFGAFYALLYIV